MRAAFVGLIASFLLAACAGGTRSALPVEVIRIDTASGTKSFVVEIAANVQSREKGLMYREQLAANAGMLFDFREDVHAAFWMKDTPLALDMLFIRADGTVSSVRQNAEPFSTAIIPSAEPVRAVLEIRGGESHLLGIRPGDRVHAAIFDG